MSWSLDLMGYYKISHQEIQAMAVHKNYAFVAFKNLLVLDITNPKTPKCVMTYDSIKNVKGIKIFNNHVYILHNEKTISIFSLQNNTSLKKVKSIQLTAKPVSIEISELCAFVGCTDGTLYIIDVSETTNPLFIGTFIAPNPIASIKVSENYVYLACRRSGLIILDISDKAHPKFTGICNFPIGIAHAINISDKYLFMANAGGIYVVDVKDPQNPQCVTTYKTESIAQCLAIKESNLYVGTASNGLCVVNIDNPLKPTFIGRFDTPGSISYIYTKDLIAYLADDIGGFWCIDISSNTSPNHSIKRMVPNNKVKKLHISDNKLYAICDTMTRTIEKSNIYIFDIKNPLQPKILGRHTTQQVVNSLAVKNSDVYFLDDNEFQLYDFFNPINPICMGKYIFANFSSMNADIIIHDEYAYLKTEFDVMLIIDMSIPSQMNYKNHWRRCYNGPITESNNLFYNISTNTLQLIDPRISLNVPFVLGSCSLNTETSNDIIINNGYVYVGSEDIQVIDVHKNSSPKSCGYYQTPGRVMDMAIKNNLLFVADGFNQISVFDISNPLNQKKLQSYYTNHRSVSIVPYKKYIYSAEENDGIHIIKQNDSIPIISNTVQKLPKSRSILSVKPLGTFPFTVQITISIPPSLQTKGNIVCRIINGKGQRITTLLSSNFTSGTHHLYWEPVKDRTESISIGIYICELLIGRDIHEKIIFTICK